MKKKLFLISLCLASMILGALLSQFFFNPQTVHAGEYTMYKCLALKDESKLEFVLNEMSKTGWEFVQTEIASELILIFKK